MTSDENNVSEPPNLKFSEEDNPTPHYKALACGTRDHTPRLEKT